MHVGSPSFTSGDEEIRGADHLEAGTFCGWEALYSSPPKPGTAAQPLPSSCLLGLSRINSSSIKRRAARLFLSVGFPRHWQAEG